MKEQWRKELQDKMADYSQAAPPMPWDEIERAVAAQRQPRRARHLSLWQRMSVAAAITLLIGVAASLLWHTSNDGEQQLASVSTPSATTTATTTPTATSIATEPDAEPLDGESLLAQHVVRHKPQDARGYSAGEAAPTTTALALASQQVVTSEAPQSATQKSEEVAPASSTETAETATSPQASTRKQTALPSAMDDWNEDRATSRYEHRLMAQASVSNSFLNTTSLQRSGMMNTYASNTTQNTFAATTDELNRPVLAAGSVPTERVHHRLPVRFALSLSYELSPRWSLSAGIAYTLLSADVTRDTGAHEEQWKQSLHYVGIPLHVNYQLWSTHCLQLYATMGGTVEKMVSGSRTLQTGDAGHSEISESVSIHPFQLSIDGGLGAAYTFHPQFSIYAEPTVGYHFDNGSSVPTYYQKHPFSWGLTIGLRMHLNSK